MATVSGILFFLFGAAIGSFLNVLIARYDPARSLFYFPALLGRSRCPRCKKTLGVFELVPIFSFIFLRAKCRGCKGSIRFRYPLVEILSGLIFILVPLALTQFYGFSLSAFFLFLSPLWFSFLVGIWIFAFLAFLLIAFIDAEHYLIPDELNIFIIICGIGISWIFFAVWNVFKAIFRIFYSSLRASFFFIHEPISFACYRFFCCRTFFLRPRFVDSGERHGNG